MDISDLKCFLMVVREGGVCRAAVKLNRFQSNVSTRIQKLERDVGTTLFLREGRSIRLSAKGKVFLGYAQKMVALDEHTRWAMSDDATPRGRLRIGAMESAAASRLPAALASFHRRYPEVGLELQTGPTRKLHALLLADEIDVAFVAETDMDSGIQSCVLFNEELCLISPDTASLTPYPEDFAEMSLITFSQGCVYRELLEAWFRNAGVIPRRKFEMSSYHGIISCVAAGTGVSVVPRSTLESLASPAPLGVSPFPFRPTINTLLIWRAGDENATIRCLRDNLQSGSVPDFGRC